MIEIEWGGHAWQLRPDRTLYWPGAQTLVLADPHFGKAQFFRDAGVPVPAASLHAPAPGIPLIQMA